MGEAIQILPPTILFTRVVLPVPQGTARSARAPFVAYPADLRIVNASVATLGVGTYNITVGYLSLIGLNVATPQHFNFGTPFPIGGYFMSIGGVQFFTNLAAPPVGQVVVAPAGPAGALQTFVQYQIRNNANADIVVTLDLGYSIVSRAVDISPTFYPGFGPAQTISSENI